ncbi:MAG: hypothetical protein DCC55_20430 [Chloroflexi bacterium]|nr:MAG: hypothetical protein DCC55_20430 [Chloroflexota bacterium]
MNIWQKLALVIATVALVGGALYAGTAYAQTPTPTPDSQNDAQTPGATVRGWFMERFGGRGMMRGDHFGGRGMMPGGRFGGRSMMGQPFGFMGAPVLADRLDILAEVLDMTTEELQAELNSGKTLLAIAEAQGLDETELQAAFEAALGERLDQAVADGDLTQAQADAIKANLAREIPFFGRGFGLDGFGMRRPGMGGQVLAGIIGDPKELVAEAADMTVEELETAIKGVIEQRLESAVEEGKITQGEADAWMERLEEGLPFFGEGFGGRYLQRGWRR